LKNYYIFVAGQAVTGNSQTEDQYLENEKNKNGG